MQTLTKEKIRSLVGQKIYQRGSAYYREDRVTHIETNKVGSFTQVSARVIGSKSYHTEVLLNEESEVRDEFCTCPAFEGGFDYCKHIAALLLTQTGAPSRPSTDLPSFFKKKQKQPDEWEQTSSLKKLFVDYFAGRMQTVESIGEALKTEYALSFRTDHSHSQEYYFSIQLKIGTDKKYVVKDIEALLAAMRQRSLLPFTKKFTFDPTNHYFKEEDLAVLRKLEDILRNQSWGEGQRGYFMSGSGQKSEVEVPPVAANDMLNALFSCENVYIRTSFGSEIPLTVKQSWPGEFVLNREKNHYYLTYSSFAYPPRNVSLTPYYLWNDKLYETKEEDRSTKLLFHMLMDTPKGRLPLKKDELEQVYANIVLPLKEKSRLKLDNEVEKNVIEHPLQAKVYLEALEGSIQAEPLFTYGSHSFHAVTEERPPAEDDRLISRNVQKEEEILQLFEEAGFHWNGKALSLTDEEDIIYFLLEILPELKKKAVVFMSRDLDNMIVESSSFSLESKLDSSLSWLDISFQTDDLDEQELYELMRSLKEKKKFHKTRDGRFVPLEDEMFEDLRSLLTDESATDFENGSLRFPAYKAFQMDQYMESGRRWAKDESLEKLLSDIRTPEERHSPLPAGLNASLRDYQEKGYQWFKVLSEYGFGGILADDMGLGKTLQTLTFILSEREISQAEPPFLVVAPSSLVYNWEKEAAFFTPRLRTSIIQGSKEERRQQLTNINGSDVLITSYPLLRRDTDLYEDLEFQGIILDEAQAVKNHTSKTFRSVRQLKTKKAFALSGTPIENKVEELWSLFAILMPGLFSDIKAFKSLEPKQVSQRISPFILRRTKKEVLKELPDKIETTRHCELSKKQRETYVAYLNRIKTETALQLEAGFQQNRMNILANLTRLRQLCCHPGMFLEDYTGGSGKLDELMEFMQEARENNNRVLVFSQFTTMLSIISEAFNKEGLDYFYLDGQTPSQERLALTERFNQGEKEAFLISLKAGGTGLNLTGADTVVLFDLWWNPAVENQAADRAHRIGQKQVVQVMKLISQGTIEEKIQQLQDKKKALFDQVIQSGETSLSSLSENDIRELLEL
ncbi:SNF2 helicase associated domain-containing protein [Alteribacillus sp. HJP-4]|uniref:DEAD/DEAH box helicase n=1 Tax=Alteribacillus sp. HJP-4 TaxID=2775394 RepID=UPI0035CD10AF